MRVSPHLTTRATAPSITTDPLQLNRSLDPTQTLRRSLRWLTMIPANVRMEHVIVRPRKTANTVVSIAKKPKNPR